MKKVNDELTAAKLQFNKEISQLKEQNNSLDQYLRSNNLFFRNFHIPENCEGARLAYYVANKLNYLMPYLDIPVSVHNINITHPMRTNAQGHTLIIVRFTNRHVRHNIYENRLHLQNYGITVTEHLTQYNVKLLHAAKNKVGQDNAWSYNGKIFALSNGKRVIISNNLHVENLEVGDKTTSHSHRYNRNFNSEYSSYRDATTGQTRRGRGSYRGYRGNSSRSQRNW